MRAHSSHTKKLRRQKKEKMLTAMLDSVPTLRVIRDTTKKVLDCFRAFVALDCRVRQVTILVSLGERNLGRVKMHVRRGEMNTWRGKNIVFFRSTTPMPLLFSTRPHGHFALSPGFALLEKPRWRDRDKYSENWRL